ncbi:hypothetical protein AMATHDRAFT_47994 [Amanita thiersii Skay4041]|uniref:Uncharacterized protein n=1 Tax=Amanita thiersii Skay4041 TaxID=703135 RepID=A0A2A9NPV4_9AGAR|nr:hypothetical protein AMATHDRAFT_47994 [Amanita thiersii Skay4041]
MVNHHNPHSLISNPPPILRLGSMHARRPAGVSLSEWRRYCHQVFHRDSYVCSTCGYQFAQLVMGKVQIDCGIVSSGSSNSNSPTNVDFRSDDSEESISMQLLSEVDLDPSKAHVYCPPCASIQTLQGYSRPGFPGWLMLARSDMDQAEIVRITRRLNEQTGIIPHIREVDPLATVVRIGDAGLVEWLRDKDQWSDSDEETIIGVKGFFTQAASKLFWKRCQSDDQLEANVSDRIQLANRAAERALLAEKPQFDVVAYTPRTHGSLDQFFRDWRPSATSRSEYKWIYVDNSLRQTPYLSPEFNRAGLWSAWIRLCSQPSLVAEDIDDLARKFNLLGGKWLLFIETKKVDNTWNRVARAAHRGRFGPAVKVSPNQDSGTHVIEVYTENYLDLNDVFRVREELRQLGFKKRTSYKPDIYGRLAIHSGNAYGIQPARYLA